MKKFAAFIFLHCFFPLLIGVIVYLFFRPAFFAPMPKITLQHQWLEQLLFTLPDFCWSYSFAAALYLFSIYYQVSFKWSSLLIFVAVTASEVAQLAFPQQFTFDVFDLVAVVVAFLFCTFRIAKKIYEKGF
jgi:hypothetical protein